MYIFTYLIYKCIFLHILYVYISGVDDNGSGVAALLEVIRQIMDMNKKGTKRGNTIIFASFDLEEYRKLNITYLKLWWNNIYDNTIYISKHYYIKYQVIICRFILELYINFNVSQNTGKLIKILIICGLGLIWRSRDEKKPITNSSMASSFYNTNSELFVHIHFLIRIEVIYVIPLFISVFTMGIYNIFLILPFPPLRSNRDIIFYENMTYPW